MELKNIRLFIQVYQKGSFAEVAKIYNVSPSSITRSIMGLEDKLGVRLFQRTTRSVTPTEYGENYYQKVAPLLEEIETINEDLKSRGEKVSGKLKLTAPSSFGQVHLPSLCKEFNKIYPDIRFELLITDSIVDIPSEQVDLGIRFGQLKDSSLISTKLCPLDYVVCASKSYLKNKKPIKKPEDLSQHKCITFIFSNFRKHWKFKKNKTIKEVAITPYILASNGLTQKEMALSGIGVILLPKTLIQKELDSGKLINLFPNYEVSVNNFDAGIWLIYPSRNFLPTKTRVFIDFIKEKFS